LPNCGANYNLANIVDKELGLNMPPLEPKKAGHCDKCNEKLIQRDDDKEEIVNNRLQIYHKHTAPLEDYYKAKASLKLALDPHGSMTVIEQKSKGEENRKKVSSMDVELPKLLSINPGLTWIDFDVSQGKKKSRKSIRKSI